MLMTNRVAQMLRSGLLVMAVVLSGQVAMAEGLIPEWQKIQESAKGQTVYFNGWGGSDVINDYIRWAGKRVEKEYGVEVKHVKVTDIGDVVGRILAEKSAGRTSGGTVDMVWINGEILRASTPTPSSRRSRS